MHHFLCLTHCNMCFTCYICPMSHVAWVTYTRVYIVYQFIGNSNISTKFWEYYFCKIFSSITFTLRLAFQIFPLRLRDSALKSWVALFNWYKWIAYISTISKHGTGPRFEEETHWNNFTEFNHSLSLQITDTWDRHSTINDEIAFLVRFEFKAM